MGDSPASGRSHGITGCDRIRTLLAESAARVKAMGGGGQQQMEPLRASAALAMPPIASQEDFASDPEVASLTGTDMNLFRWGPTFWVNPRLRHSTHAGVFRGPVSATQLFE